LFGNARVVRPARPEAGSEDFGTALYAELALRRLAATTVPVD